MTIRYHIFDQGACFDVSERELAQAMRDHVFSAKALIRPRDEATQAWERRALACVEAKVDEAQVKAQRRRQQEQLVSSFQAFNRPLVDLRGNGNAKANAKAE